MDTFDVLAQHYAGKGAWEGIEGRLERGEISVRDALTEEAALVRASFDEAMKVLYATVRFDESFVDFVAACRDRDMAVTVVSSGLEPVIRQALRRYGLADVPVVANRLEPAAIGWRIVFRDDSPNGTDKTRFVRAAQARGSYTVFIGDGRSDFEAAAAADRRFARAGRSLEAFLRRERIAFESFESFSEITRALLRAA